jgi:hypothetical protein
MKRHDEAIAQIGDGAAGNAGTKRQRIHPCLQFCVRSRISTELNHYEGPENPDGPRRLPVGTTHGTMRLFVEAHKISLVQNDSKESRGGVCPDLPLTAA